LWQSIAIEGVGAAAFRPAGGPLFLKREENSMVRRSAEKTVVRKPAPFNGVGEITVRSLANNDAELNNKGRVFGHTTVYPGSEIGYHVHNGDEELYYILSGRGRYNDNGTMTEVGPGDVTICPAGQGHGIACIGDEPIEMIALILYV
jgi:mannose-6-phosphate isomerase-like protein (cupin superfamily)